MNVLPAGIEASSARLPQTYENARQALAQCAKLDECMDWADKAAALASYARQANDSQLEKMALRIRDRAVRRCGELLKQFDGKGRNQHKELREGALPKLSQREAAEAAGISTAQTKQAVRVANVPAAKFEQQVESDKPPTVTALAKQGAKPATPRAAPPPPPAPLINLKGRDPREFNQALHYLGPIERYAKDIESLSHDAVLPILTDEERQELRALIARIDAVHDMIVTRI